MKDKTYSVGIITPISGTSATHTEAFYKEALSMVKSTFTADKFSTPSIVSQQDSRSDLLNRILRGLSQSDIVVADLTDQNPNVAFEVGVRFVFDKPMIFYRSRDSHAFSDFASQYCHRYPEDFRYQGVADFKKSLLAACMSELEKVEKNPDYSPFLADHAIFDTPSLPVNTKGLMDNLSDMQSQIRALEKRLPDGEIMNRDASIQLGRYYRDSLAKGVRDAGIKVPWNLD